MKNNRTGQVKKESLYDENWALLRRFHSPMEASIAAGLLDSADIPSYQLDSTVNFYMRDRGESNLYVRNCDMDQAIRILRELDTAEALTEEELAEEALKYTAEE